MGQQLAIVDKHSENCFLRRRFIRSPFALSLGKEDAS